MTENTFRVLAGSRIIEDRGLDGEGIKVECRWCSNYHIAKNENSAGYFLDRWLCHSCKNNLLVRHDGEPKQPADLLSLHSLQTHGTITTDGGEQYEVIREDAEELTDAHLAAYMLNREGRHGEYGLGTYNIPPHKPYIVLDKREAIGYLLWSEATNGGMVLRQLFLRESYRRQGIGSALLDYWWHDVAKSYCKDDGEDFYHIESPNDQMIEMVLSTGHDGKDGRPKAYAYSLG